MKEFNMELQRDNNMLRDHFGLGPGPQPSAALANLGEGPTFNAEQLQQQLPQHQPDWDGRNGPPPHPQHHQQVMQHPQQMQQMQDGGQRPSPPRRQGSEDGSEEKKTGSF